MQDDKILISKVLDKYKFSKSKGIVTNTEFFNETENALLIKELQKNNIKNYVFDGGFKEAQRKILIFYPNSIEDIERAEILKAIKIELPKENFGKFEHKNYLGTLMSFGLDRSRIGEIIVYNNLAYIVVLNENAEYLKSSLELEKRFKKAKISIIDIDEIIPKENQFEEITILLNSLRLDNVVSELANTSRKISQELIEDEKVLVNYIEETKSTKLIKAKDIITIRGKGKFIIEELLGKNKKEKEIVLVKKYK